MRSRFLDQRVARRWLAKSWLTSANEESSHNRFLEVNFKAVIAALESGGESMTTMTQLRSGRSDAVVQLARPADEHPAPYHFVGRLIQISLAVYLLPALFLVLIVGSAGILALKIGRVFGDLLER